MAYLTDVLEREAYEDAVDPVTEDDLPVSDLTVLDGSPSSDVAPLVVVQRPGITRVADTGVDAVPSPEARHIVNSGPPGSLIPGKTLLLMDSFGIAAMEQIGPWFEDLTAVSLNSFDPALFLSLVQHADRVWFLSVERELPRRVATDWSASIAPIRNSEDDSRSPPLWRNW